jgi:hypothetical protein
MANPILARRADKSLAKVIKAGFKDGSFTMAELNQVFKEAMDGGVLDDQEYRDLRRFLRKEQRLTFLDRLLMEMFIHANYPMEGPFLYPGNIDDLEGAAPLGSHQCAALVQSSQPIGLTKTWRQGIPVRGNENLIVKGTAVATFEDGFYANRAHDNHVAYYISQDSSGIKVMDQWSEKGEISSRVMGFKGTRADGLFPDPSNNGDALSVIMRKKT